MDAITLLRNDHKSVQQLFKRFEKAGKSAHVEKRQIVDRIIEELSIHATIEEQFFYPATRANVPDVEDIALESLEEHHLVKWTLSELDGLDPASERFDAKVTVLIENVRHHVEEEETEFFPKVRSALGRKALDELGTAMNHAKATAPTHPHPRSPDTPPANAVVGAIAGVIDRVGDNISGIAHGGVEAAQGLLAKATGTTTKATKRTPARAASKSVSTPVKAASASTKKVSSKTASKVAPAAKKAASSVASTSKAASKGAAKAASKASSKS